MKKVNVNMILTPYGKLIQKVVLTEEDIKFIEKYTKDKYPVGQGYRFMLMRFLNEYKQRKK